MLTDAISKFKAWNIESQVGRIYSRIDNRYKYIFVALLLLNILAYFIFIAHHPIHNHGFRMPWIGPNDQVFAGRWLNKYLLPLYYLADLPVFLPLVGIVMNVCAGMVLLRIWRFKLSAFSEFLVLAALTTFPMSLAYFFYTYQTPLFFTAALFAVTAVYTCQRMEIRAIALSSVCVMLQMASYQPALSIWAVVAVSAAIAELLRPATASAPAQTILQVIRRSAARLLAGCIGLVMYKASLALFGIRSSHATQTVSLGDLPERIARVASESVRHLTLTQPDLLEPMKLMLLAGLVLAVLVSMLLLRASPLRMLVVVALWGLLLIATKAMFLVSSDNGFWQYRYNGGLAFFHAFSFAVVLFGVTFGPVRFAILAFFMLIVVRFVQADLVRQEVLLRGQQHDLAFANRILVRIESLPQIDFSKTYDLVRVGQYSSFRSDLLRAGGRNYQQIGDVHLDRAEISARWTDEDVFRLLGARVNFRFRGMDPDFAAKEADIRARLLKDRQKWPHADSVFIDGETIIVYMN